MKLKPLLELLAFLGAELLSSSLGMLSIDTCSPRPMAIKRPEIATPLSTVLESPKPARGNVFKAPFFGSPAKEIPISSSTAEIMAAA
jgi:hypothetical protein